MKRDLERMASKKFDLLVIGGGISGAAIAHDASLRGLTVALVEKGDFGCATSGATSKLIHGGLRYLKNLEFGLVRESLRERRIMEYIAPHLVAPTPFMIPTYKGQSNNKPTMWAAMELYNRLSFDKGRLDDLDRKIPKWKPYSRKETLVQEPGLKTDGLTGAVLYYDCQMWSPERLTLEFVQAAVENGACVANYARVEKLLKDGKEIQGACVKDLLTDREFEIRSRMTINAAGPWADFVSGMIEGAGKKLVRSQGIHMITRKLAQSHALVLSSPGGRLFFIIPWRGLSLIGTTDTRYEGHPDGYRVTTARVREFIDEVNAAMPSAALSMEDILWTYGGLRPIVETETAVKDVNKASRRYEIHDHQNEDGTQGFITVIGGKYTTSRVLAEKVVELASRKLNFPIPSRTTAGYILPGGRIGSWAGFKVRLMRNFDMSASDAALWARTYGTRAAGMAIEMRTDPELAAPIDPRQFETLAAVDMAVKSEMAVKLQDVIFRRTGLGTTGQLSDEAVANVAARMALLLAWTTEQKDAEIRETVAKLHSRGMAEE